jgi:acyl carrier protein
LARHWVELLNVERVGRHDNFFELGGHSLLALRLVARVSNAFGVKIRIATLFEAPTVREFAACVSKGEPPLETWKDIVKIQSVVDKTPIIVINHPRAYYNLARKIGMDRPPAFSCMIPAILRRCRAKLDEIASDYVPRGAACGLYLFDYVAGLVGYEVEAAESRFAGRRGRHLAPAIWSVFRSSCVFSIAGQTCSMASSIISSSSETAGAGWRFSRPTG